MKELAQSLVHVSIKMPSGCSVTVSVPTTQSALGSSFHTKRSRKVELDQVGIVSFLNFSFSEIQLSLKLYFVLLQF